MSRRRGRPGRVFPCAALLAGLTFMTTGYRMDRGAPELPKVPFGNHPCQSLSTGDQGTLKMPGSMDAKSDRAPATLPFDNMCTYTHGGTKYAQVGFETKADYDLNTRGNRSSSHQAPADVPGAFYDKQGGLWFAKNGYFVVVSGRSELTESVARLIVAKL